VVKAAGYSAGELGDLPPEAVVNSFGCGNPVAFAGIKEGDVVLDLGSGAGIDLFLAAKKVGGSGRAIGIDMTDDMIAQANRNIAETGVTNVEVRKGIIEEMPVADSSVDWIISNCVINLSPEKPRVFAEMARVLKPAGQILVSDIVANELPEWVMKDRSLYNSCLAGAIGEEAYLAGLRQAGLTDVEVRDRLVYEQVQLREFVDSELSECSGCCGSSSTLSPEEVDRLIEEMQGKVYSALIYARR
jgi:SAM-dependent methyltransferase